MSEFFEIDHLPNRTIRHNGREYLFFSGTAYLGLPQHAAFHQLVIDGIGRYGPVFGSSRNGNLRIDVYEKAEAKLAVWTGTPDNRPEAALTLSSGMMAGQVVINLLRKQNYSFIYAPNTHPALWHEPEITSPTMSFGDWTAQLPGQLERLGDGPVAILTNSLQAVCSEYYSFDWINDWPDARPVTLVVDDSHGVGVLNNGLGIWPQIPQNAGVRLLVTASLAKAMGLPGGVVLGDARTLADLRNSAFFGACSPMPPAYLDAYLNADALYTEGLDRLQQNLILAEKLLLPTGLFRHAKGYPVFFTEEDDLYQHLLNNDIFIYSFAYPTSADRANTRIVISAFHTFEDIQKLANAVYAFIL